MAGTQPANQKIKIANPPLETSVKTSLQSDTAAGATSLTVVSTTGFPGTSADDYYALIGSYGDQKSEIVLIDTSATTTSVFTCGATKYSHSASDPVTIIKYNKIRIYGGSTTGFTPVIDSPIETIDIDVTEQYTEYSYTSPTYSYFVTAYYDSTNEEISGYSDEITSTTFTRYTTKKIIESAAIKALTRIDDNKGSTLNWDNAIEILQDGIDELVARKRRWPFLRTLDSTTTTANQAYITKPADMSQLVYMKINNQMVEWISLLDYSRYTATAVSTTGSPAYYTEKNNLLYLYPTPDSTHTVVRDYFKYPATITSLTTEVDKPFLTPLIYYCASQFAYLRGNDKRGDKMYAMFERLLEQQVVEYSGPEQDGFAEYVEQTTALSDANLI